MALLKSGIQKLKVVKIFGNISRKAKNISWLEAMIIFADAFSKNNKLLQPIFYFVLVYNPTKSPDARICPFMAASISGLVAPFFRGNQQSRAYSLK